MSRYPKGQVDGLTREDRELLATVEGRLVFARIDAAVGEFHARDVDRDEHVRGIALVCVRAKASNPTGNRQAPAETPARDASAGAR